MSTKNNQELQLHNPFSKLPAMKVIDMSTKASAKAYLTEPVEKTHTKEELEAVHRAIHFTQQFKQAESYNKMDEEELVERPIPRL